MGKVEVVLPSDVAADLKEKGDSLRCYPQSSLEKLLLLYHTFRVNENISVDSCLDQIYLSFTLLSLMAPQTHQGREPCHLGMHTWNQDNLICHVSVSIKYSQVSWLFLANFKTVASSCLLKSYSNPVTSLVGHM